MKKQLRFIYLLLIVLVLASYNAKAQTAFASEEELKTQASKLFNDDEFEESYPLYSQLLSIYPKDANYNYRLGVCMLYASDDKEKAIPFLEFASKKQDVEKEVFFYLAKAYHLNYRFDDAIAQYLAYKKLASEAKAEKLQVDRQIEMCKNGKKLLRNLTDLIVIEKKEMSRTDFFRSYDISDIGGKLLVKPDEPAFKTAADKKKKEKSIIYLASNNNQIYFSSYGDDPERGKDIYLIRKLPTGEWSKPQTLGYPVNTEYDEDFPFLHPNGKVLYFCSKGHNSMGGYDIFKTTLNEETDTWNKPVNMDFPINTPDDDVLYVTNADEKEAFFSSSRASVTGKTAVYHINVERKPVDVAIIKGAVVPNRNGQALDVKITVKDLGDNTILGIYNSKAETGVYLINLPNGGKFMFTVEAAGFATQSEVISLPTQYIFKPLKQEISYELGTDKLIVKNLFDEPVDDASYLLALNFIKERSKMEVNANDTSATVNAIEIASNKTTDNTEQNTTEVKDNTTPKTNTSLTNDDIIKIAYGDAKDAETEAKELQEQTDIALNLANEKNELAQNKTREATQLMADANKMDDNIKKQATIDEANDVNKAAEILNQEMVAAFNIAKKLGLKASAKDEEADLSLQYAKDLEAAVKSKNPADAMAKLDEQEKKLDALNKKNGNAEPDNIYSGLKSDEATKQRELDKAVQATNDIKEEIADNATLITNINSDIEKTKKDDLKKGLQDQIAELKQDNINKQKELEQNELKVAQAEKEYNGIKNEIALVTNVVDQSKIGDNESATASAAKIDKTKLEQQVNEIKNSTENIVAVTPINTTSTENKTTDVAVAETKNDFHKKYDDELAATDIITNDLERETKKADLYKAYVNSINDEITSKKKKFASEEDTTKKKILVQEITILENEQNEKQKANTDAIAAVEKIKEQEAVAASSIIENKTAIENITIEQPSVTTEQFVNINQKFTNQLADAEKITNEADRDKAKAEALINWSSAIEDDNLKKKKEMVATTDPEMKALLALKIYDGGVLSKEKQTQANQILNKQNTVANNTTTENKTTDVAVVPTNTITENTTTDVAVVPANTITENITTDVAVVPTNTNIENKTTDIAITPNNSTSDNNFLSASAKELSKKSEAANKESDDLLAQANELKTRAEAKNKQTDKDALYAQAEEVTKLSETKKIESKKLITAANEIEFDRNQNTLNQYAATSIGNESDEVSMAEMMKDEAKIYNDRAKKSIDLAANTESVYDKGTALEDAANNQKIALEKQQKATELYKKNNLGFVPATNNAIVSNTISGNKTSDVVVTPSNATTDIVVTPNNTTTDIAVTRANATTSGTKLDANEKFIRSTQPVYSASKPIPINEKLPEGLVFKVQIGAFRNPIAPEIFKGMSPISAETTPSGLMRYTAGLFTKFSSADNIKNEIRGLGYKDAFVVAFLNGKRISMTETIAAIKGSIAVVNSATSNNTVPLTNNEQQQPVVNNTQPPNSTNITETQNISTLGGLFYTVQVGVYSQPVTSAKLRNCQPLYSEKTTNGLIRYTTGIYNNVARANEAKKIAVNVGIADAFVSAYHNGKRISMPEATTLETQGLSIFSTASGMNNLPTFTGSANSTVIPKSITTVQPIITQEPKTAIEQPATNTQPIDPGVVFKVQIGAFKEQVPLEIANKFLKIAKKGVKNYKDENGLTVYTVGVYKTYEEANQAKTEVANESGVADAFIVAYNEGKKISIEEAKLLLNK